MKRVINYKTLGSILRLMGYDKRACSFIAQIDENTEHGQYIVHERKMRITSQTKLYDQVDNIDWHATRFYTTISQIHTDLFDNHKDK